MALVEASKGLLGTLDLDSLLRSVLDGGTRLAGAQDGFVCLFDHETGTIDRGVFRGVDKGGIRMLVAEEKVQRAIQSTTVTTLETAADTTLTAVGLRTSRGTKGLLAVVADPRQMAERADLLMAFGQQCASAIESAELYSVVERKESELASIIQAVPNPIVLVDARDRIVAMNPAAEDLFGISSTFSIGAPVAGALGHAEVEATLSDHGAFTAEVEAGSPARTYKLRVADVRVPGAPMGRVLIMDDVTAEREIAQTQRDFVAMIGHELRTPLTIIKGFARTLIRRIESASTDETIEALSTIDTKAGHLERLIEDLLYVSNVESREAVLKCEEIDLGQVMARVSDEVIQQFPTRQIGLECPRSLVWPADETKVALVLRHLLNNALKYSEDPAPVTLRVSQEEDEVQFDVVDKGAGLLSSDLPTIFERFRQIDSSSTRAHGGTGVGLYLCAQLVRMHGGRIWVDSTWGKGSTFSFTLPYRAPTRRVVQLHGTTQRSA
jgi:two-component system, OmpR family, phosphate regulon sensor histidine kinase PhoR